MGNENSYGRPEDLDTMKKYQGFTPRHIMMIKERLDMLADEDLTIDKQSFQLAMKSKEEETNRIFQLFDLSNDGKIETLEFTCALALLSHASLYEKCSIIFGLYDFDRNRTMTKNELIILIKTVLTSLNAMTSKGECTIQEAETMAEEILRRYDTNKDASISLKEFHSFVSKDPDILKMLLSFALISKEDLRFNFGMQSLDIPDADSDLEMEIYKSHQMPDERMERISMGIEHNYETTELEDLVMNEEEEENGGKLQQEENQNLQSRSKFPWMPNALKFPDLGWKQQVFDSNPPSASLEIVRVYGFRGFDTRNNLKYFVNNDQNELVYHCGSIGICLDPSKNTQRFFTEHTDDITCLDVGESVAVTGQMGRQPLLCVWDLATMETKAILKGVLKIGVSNISLSNDGKKVAAIGMDDEQCIVIYDIEKAQSARLSGRKDESLVASGKGPRSEIFDIKFDKSDKTIIVACKCEVNFVTFEGNILKVARGVWETKTCPLQTVLCIGLMDNSIVTGTFKGSLILWRGNRTTNHVEAHRGAVLAIHTRKKEIGVITGGKDGYILYWDANLKEKMRTFLGDLDITVSSLRVTAICESANGNMLAIGTRGAEIIELISGKPRQELESYISVRKAMSGHYYGNLRGMVCHPRLTYFYTVGEDSLVMKWNYREMRLEQSKKLEYQSRTLDIWDDRYLAIGCHNGNIVILEPKNIQNQLHEFKDRDSEISCVKFSPEGDFLLVGYSEPYCEMFIYGVVQHFKKVAIVGGFHSSITSMDFSTTRRIVMCALKNQELSYVDLTDEQHGRIVGNGEKLSDGSFVIGEQEYSSEQWVTFTAQYGWAVAGIWPEVAEGDDINAVDRAKQSSIIVVADDYSALKLFRFPAYTGNQSYTRYTGHSNHVSNVRFTCNDEYVISLGGEEKSIIQWKFIKDQELQASYDKSYIEEKAAKKQKTTEEEEDEDEEQIQQKKQIKINSENKPYLQHLKGMVPSHQQAEDDDPNGGGIGPRSGGLPGQQLQLTYAFGCRTEFEGLTITNVVRYSFTGKVVFPTAGVVVVQECKVTAQGYRPQSFFVRHSQDVVAMAMHPKGNIIATGTAAPECNATMLVEIMIWEVESKAMLCFIQDFHLRGISHLEFSPDGTLLLTLGMDDDHSLAIYDWQANRLLCTAKVDKSPVIAISWRGPKGFVTCGQRHFKFWTQQGRNLKCHQGNFAPTNGNDAPYEPQTAMTYAFQMEVVSGSENGSIYLWKSTSTCQRQLRQHEGRINLLVAVKQALYSAGADGKIILWSLNQNQLQVAQVIVEMNRVLGRQISARGIVSLDMKNESFAVVVDDGELWECVNGNPVRTTQLLTWHHGGVLLSVANLPNSRKFVSCGTDGVLRVWDLDQKRQIGNYKITENDNQLRALDCTNDGAWLIVGDFKCHLYLLDTVEFKVVDKKPTKFASMKPRRGCYMISELKFSPDSRRVAVGASGGPSHIEIWDLDENGQFMKQSLPMVANLGFTSSLTHMDWSKDGQFIMATSDSFELKFLSIQRQRDVSVNLVRDVQWASWTCPYGYQVSGICKKVS